MEIIAARYLNTQTGEIIVSDTPPTQGGPFIHATFVPRDESGGVAAEYFFFEEDLSNIADWWTLYMDGRQRTLFHRVINRPGSCFCFLYGGQDEPQFEMIDDAANALLRATYVYDDYAVLGHPKPSWTLTRRYDAVVASTTEGAG
jgi:hypothetical protein